MSLPPLLKLENIDLVIGKNYLLENITLKVDPGEILTVIGPNGAGKTTLVRVALGLQQPTSGRVHMSNGLRIGYVPQRLQIDPTFPLTVERFLKLAGKNAMDRILPLLEEVSATHALDTALQKVSGGELQRILLARALMQDPDLLVLDEPVQGVDVHGQTELYELITRISTERGCAVLMVSHDLHLVMAATDRVLCLNRHICCSGTPEVVTNDPAYLELFGPQAVEALAVYTHNREHHHDNCSHTQGGES